MAGGGARRRELMSVSRPLQPLPKARHTAACFDRLLGGGPAARGKLAAGASSSSP